jgi:hypothetical protein
MRVMIRYKVKRDQVEHDVELLRGFFAELAATQPDGLRYATYQLDDRVSFVHLVETTTGPGEFARLPAFQRYRSTVADRCDEPPVLTELHEVASYRFP